MRLLRSLAVAFALGLASLPLAAAPSHAAVAVSITIAPPPLPVYVQPPIPGPGFIWVPGYWAWDVDDGDYYWVPGYWQRPPRVGLLWTPGWWGWSNGLYVFHDGYWGPRVGFYGGVVYGFGYDGVGFQGGYWRGGTFFYNRSVNNVTVDITNVYERPVNVPMTRTSFNGGVGGLAAHPTPVQLAAARQGLPPTAAQLQHLRASAADRSLRAKFNKGTPGTTALPQLERPAASGLVGKPAGGQPAGLVGKPATGRVGHPLPGTTAKPGQGFGQPTGVQTKPTVKRPPIVRQPTTGPKSAVTQQSTGKPQIQRRQIRQQPQIRKQQIQPRRQIQRQQVQQRPQMQHQQMRRQQPGQVRRPPQGL